MSFAAIVEINTKKSRKMHVSTQDGVVDLSPLMRQKISEEAFFEFCRINDDLRIEMNKNGDVIIMPPTTSETGRKNNNLATDVTIWARKDATGIVFDSSTGFTLPNGAKRSPDVSWIKNERWNALSESEKNKFAQICPDFVIELRSKTDSLQILQAKMTEYIENGAELGWLIDSANRKIYVYRPNIEVEILEKPEIVSGEPLLKHFELELKEIW